MAKQRPGRPPKDEGERKTKVVQVRATEEQRAELVAAAEAENQTLSEWALRVLLRAARRRRGRQ